MPGCRHGNPFASLIRPAGFGKKFLAGWIRENIFGGLREQIFGRRDSGKYFRPASWIRNIIFGRNFRSRSQIKVQVITINSVLDS